MNENELLILSKMTNLAQAFKDLENTLMDLSRDEDMEAIFNELCMATDAYPFNESFDDVELKVHHWVEETKKLK